MAFSHRGFLSQVSTDTRRRQLILPEVSHFALLQDPEQFIRALLHFLLRP